MVLSGIAPRHPRLAIAATVGLPASLRAGPDAPTSNVARRTGPPALDTAFEAARGGEMARAAAPVAAEMAAGRTAKPTERIFGLSAPIQGTVSQPVVAIGAITGRIQAISEVVASAAELARQPDGMKARIPGRRALQRSS